MPQAFPTPGVHHLSRRDFDNVLDDHVDPRYLHCASGALDEERASKLNSRLAGRSCCLGLSPLHVLVVFGCGRGDPAFVRM